jgi:hypothetical protein
VSGNLEINTGQDKGAIFLSMWVYSFVSDSKGKIYTYIYIYIYIYIYEYIEHLRINPGHKNSPNKDEVTGGWKELYEFYTSRNEVY